MSHGMKTDKEDKHCQNECKFDKTSYPKSDLIKPANMFLEKTNSSSNGKWSIQAN